MLGTFRSGNPGGTPAHVVCGNLSGVEAPVTLLQGAALPLYRGRTEAVEAELCSVELELSGSRVQRVTSRYTQKEKVDLIFPTG